MDFKTRHSYFQYKVFDNKSEKKLTRLFVTVLKFCKVADKKLWDGFYVDRKLFDLLTVWLEGSIWIEENIFYVYRTVSVRARVERFQVFGLESMEKVIN